MERLLDPPLAGKPVAVCGDREARHGVVLAKSEEAKKFGVKTGDTVWQAQRKCRDIVIVPPHFEEYIEYSKKVRAVYARYTDLIESYGIDECWLDITRSTLLFPEYGGEKYLTENGTKYYSEGFLLHLGDVIRNAVKDELGVTVSCGVSFNKVFAKLGSDIKKPDGTTVISKARFRDIIYGLPVEDLLFVGGATKEKLKQMGLNTIGNLAAADDKLITDTFGKFGRTLLKNARGEDIDPVKHMDEKREMKSIGNSCTYPKDVTELPMDSAAPQRFRQGRIKAALCRASRSRPLDTCRNCLWTSFHVFRPYAWFISGCATARLTIFLFRKRCGTPRFAAR